jgi:hypothetical protein
LFYTITYSIVLFIGIAAHGRSEEMIRTLNAPVPAWMSLAEAIKVEPVAAENFAQDYSFRPRSGGATNSRNRVQIPELKIEFEVNYSIDYFGRKSAGHGVSLSPDRRKLLVNSGTNSHLYEISPSGDYKEIPIRLPHITYDAGPKGIITEWGWAGNDILAGTASITDDTGHELVDTRIYLFYLKEQALARLDISALPSKPPSALEVVSFGEDLQHLRIKWGGELFSLKADLAAPPKLITSTNSPLNSAPKANPLQDSSTAANARREDSNGSSGFWTWLIAGIIALLGFCIWQMKRRKPI